MFIFHLTFSKFIFIFCLSAIAKQNFNVRQCYFCIIILYLDLLLIIVRTYNTLFKTKRENLSLPLHQSKQTIHQRGQHRRRRRRRRCWWCVCVCPPMRLCASINITFLWWHCSYSSSSFYVETFFHFSSILIRSLISFFLYPSIHTHTQLCAIRSQLFLAFVQFRLSQKQNQILFGISDSLTSFYFTYYALLLLLLFLFRLFLFCFKRKSRINPLSSVRRQFTLTLLISLSYLMSLFLYFVSIVSNFIRISNILSNSNTKWFMFSLFCLLTTS